SAGGIFHSKIQALTAFAVPLPDDLCCVSRKSCPTGLGTGHSVGAQTPSGSCAKAVPAVLVVLVASAHEGNAWRETCSSLTSRRNRQPTARGPSRMSQSTQGGSWRDDTVRRNDFRRARKT